MYMKSQKIKLDLQKRKIIHPVDAVRGEAWSRELEIELTSGQEPYFIPDNTAVIIYYQKADLKGGFYDTLPDGTPAWRVSGNLLTITLSGQVLTFPGRVMLTISFVRADTLLCTFPLELIVHPSACTDSTESEEYFNITGFLVAPHNTKVGQVLQISDVDAMGTVTGLKALDPETLSASWIASGQLQAAVEAYLTENPPAPGKDGISLSHRWLGTMLVITSASGSSAIDLKGPPGPQGIQGPIGLRGMNGLDGKNGISPTVSVSKSGRETTITITDAVGTQIASILDGADAADQAPVPDYWQPHLEEKADTIRVAMEQAGRNKSAFLFYSDAHWWQKTRTEADSPEDSYTVKLEPALLKWIYDHTPIRRTIFGGDLVGEEADVSTADGRAIMAYLWQWRKDLRNVANHHSVAGNHDDGNEVNNRYSENFVYSYLLAAEEGPDVVPGEGLYYYIDDPCEKTRYLYLDTACQGVTDGQRTFVTEALKSTPEEWHIVAVAHIWYDSDYTITPPGLGGLNSGAASLLALFDNYNARTGEFSGCGGWVEFCVGGHVHRDYDGASPGGIPILLVESSGLNDRSGLPHDPGTVTETAVTAVVADYAGGCIHLIRAGRGESRDVSLSQTRITYTNQLPIATDLDGSIYNGIGYKPDTRWSGSSNAEATYSGKYLSGYIPYTPGQTVYLQNVTIPADDSKSAIHYFSAKGTRISGTGGANAVNYFNAVTDNNNILQFTIPNYGDYTPITYIRIECIGFDETSIITVGEPIG